MSKINSVTISSGGKSVTMTPEQLKKISEGKPTNTGELVKGFISEIIRIEDAIERETDKHIRPLKENLRDIKKAAKANHLNVGALKRAASFKRASEAARDAQKQDIQDTDTYLSFVQLSLFKEE